MLHDLGGAGAAQVRRVEILPAEERVVEGDAAGHQAFRERDLEAEAVEVGFRQEVDDGERIVGELLKRGSEFRRRIGQDAGGGGGGCGDDHPFGLQAAPVVLDHPSAALRMQRTHPGPQPHVRLLGAVKRPRQLLHSVVEGERGRGIHAPASPQKGEKEATADAELVQNPPEGEPDDHIRRIRCIEAAVERPGEVVVDLAPQLAGEVVGDRFLGIRAGGERLEEEPCACRERGDVRADEVAGGEGDPAQAATAVDEEGQALRSGDGALAEPDAVEELADRRGEAGALRAPIEDAILHPRAADDAAGPIRSFEDRVLDPEGGERMAECESGDPRADDRYRGHFAHGGGEPLGGGNEA